MFTTRALRSSYCRCWCYQNSAVPPLTGRQCLATSHSASLSLSVSGLDMSVVSTLASTKGTVHAPATDLSCRFFSFLSSCFTVVAVSFFALALSSVQSASLASSNCQILSKTVSFTAEPPASKISKRAPPPRCEILSFCATNDLTTVSGRCVCTCFFVMTF